MSWTVFFLAFDTSLSVVLSHYYEGLPSTVALHLGIALCLQNGTMSMSQPMLTVALPNVPPTVEKLIHLRW